MSRGAASQLLTLAGAVLALLGGVVLYTQRAVVDREDFSDRAVDALHDDAVADLVASEVAAQLAGSVGLDLGANPSELEATLRRAIETPTFERAFRRAAAETHRSLFESDEPSVVFDVPNAGRALAQALEGIAPGLADLIPVRAEVRLLELERQNAGVRSLQAADDVGPLGAVILLIGLVALVAGYIVAPDRRAALTRAALALGVGGAIVVLLLLGLRVLMEAGTHGSYTLTDEDVGPAVGGVWAAYAGDLVVWMIVLAVGALAVALVSRRWSRTPLRSEYSAA